MPICVYCGEGVPSGAKFCPECGIPVQSAETRTSPARKMVTVLFSDLVDSTSLGEQLDAESLREVLDRYFEEMRAVLMSHGAIVEKFIGDAVMAVFGMPRMHEDDAFRAVSAAVGMRDALTDLNDTLASTHGVKLRSRTGVNTGVVVVGDATGGQRLATGDAINVAARLEQAARPGGIILGHDTFKLIRDRVEASPVGPLDLKGKSHRIRAWELVAVDDGTGSGRPTPVRPLVGRRVELAAFDARFDHAIACGRAESVLLIGEPGAGKSRLTKEVIDRLAPKATVVKAACRPYGTTSFSPLSELLRSLTGGEESPGRAELQALVNGTGLEAPDVIVERVASLLGLSRVTFPLEECFWATAQLFVGVASQGPLVLVIEDLHWAERTLFALLDHTRRQLLETQVLFLLTARPEALEDPFFSGAPSGMEILHLSPLSAVESGDLIDATLGGSPLPGSARRLIAQAGEGNPLFLEQVVTTWIEEGVLVPDGAGWRVARPMTEVRVPASVSAIFASRLDRLPDAERLILVAASVAGVTADKRALRAMLAPLDEEVLEECLEALIRSGFLHASDGAPGGELSFEHASLRDVAYEMSLKSDRATFHELFADWLVDNPREPAPDGVIGHHLAEAYRYRAELRRSDAHTFSLALRSTRHLVDECQKSLRIGDWAGEERLTDRIVEMLSECGADLGSKDLSLMEKVAKLLVTMGRWDDAVALLAPLVPSGRGPLLRDLGVALCQLHRSQPNSAEYRQGQQLLKKACAPPNRDVDALASLAGTWKPTDAARAQTIYRQCLELDPSDPYALGNVLEYEIATAGDPATVDHWREQLLAASRRCRSEADAGLNLPWAFFDAGKFALLLGDPYSAIASYAKAVQLTTADHMLGTSLSSLERLAALDGAPGWRWAKRLLTVARVVRFPSAAALAEVGDVMPLAEAGEQLRVVMVAGGTDETAEVWLQEYGGAVIESFSEFDGWVVSGGTEDGVAGLAGSLRERHGKQITAVGYLPTGVPEGTALDLRYDYVRRTAETGFSIGESLQAWADLVASGVDPATVKLLAINGGAIAGAEYRVALALGCSVGVVVGSGREADRLLEDRDWLAAPNLVRLNPDVEAISRFLSTDV